jgi:general stress protein 26
MAVSVQSPLAGRSPQGAIAEHARASHQPEEPFMTETAQHTEDTAVRIQREAIPEIARQLKAIDICMLATRGENGELHARPMSNNGEVEWDGSSWFFAPTEGRLVAEIRRDGDALATYRADDRFAWIALSGQAAVVDDAEVKRAKWVPELERWFPNGPDDPGVALIRLEATAAQWWTDEGDGLADLS